ncbi:MAG: ATP-binding cassette domain-containing protein, partial [Candidatus Sungbacteria bacterium]|nr:ATP-binding cassette domain-containing protein [Candidatus Sungbacteria bacterium]
MLTVDRLSVTIDKEEILKDISFSVSPGDVVALIGPNGAGKTTLTNKLIETYHPFTEIIGKEIRGYYYGWKPFTPLAKVAARLFRKRNTFKKISRTDQNNSFNLFQEGLFLYNYIDYSLRYLFQIYPLLRKGKIMITDRYFYDIYGQYPYAEKSLGINLLIKLFPKPDYLFVLEANTNRIMNREKANRDYSESGNENKEKEEKERRVKSKEYLDGQIRRYRKLSALCGGRIINTEKKLTDNLNEIIAESWVGIVERNNIK